ncbi:small kinetochore-associated protein isoform X2 [Mastacembelus armatus]|uniref:Kinetochore localized astrin (SPAG5) binding protein n=2 Tax=Mastacembelus armatus TaxID=205130 RepID=A0A3Q3KLR0_9TELE|nr:uncharacterized protein LOC113136897 isoform X2 [Mastacembelus armatus]XP_026173799.1 uncharacterized protein LOC113136897 isoform X2 [Mastacembelus armatus]
MSSKIPRGVQLPAETKKTGQKPDCKETANVFVTENAAQKSDGIPKLQKENIPKKNVAPKVYKGLSTRYGQQAELKEQNRHLMAANEELQKNLSETRQRVAELELQFSDLQTEKAEVQKKLRDCHVLLVAAKIDPVSGERVNEAAQQHEDQRKEAMCVSSNMLSELKTFGETASQQRVWLQEIQATMTDLMKAGEHMLEERKNYTLEVAEMEKALKEAEDLLLL